MKDKEILEGNKLIAEFMGYEVFLRSDEYAVKIGTKGYSEYLRIVCPYNNTWEKLMPVVEQLEKLKGVTIIIDGTSVSCFLFGKAAPKTFGESKIDAIWQAVVSFIKWSIPAA